jgi:hypothetical protein
MALGNKQFTKKIANIGTVNCCEIFDTDRGLQPIKRHAQMSHEVWVFSLPEIRVSLPNEIRVSFPEKCTVSATCYKDPTHSASNRRCRLDTIHMMEALNQLKTMVGP